MNILQYNQDIDNQLKVEEELEQVIIHIWHEKRNGRKSWTKVEGLSQTSININDFCKKIKNKISCGGSVMEDPKTKQKIIQLQGNHRNKITEMLLEDNIVDKNNIKYHG